MAHLVKCKVCQKSFDRDKIQAVKVSSSRYAHYTCYPQGELVPLAEQPQVDEHLSALRDYIATLFDNNANWGIVNKQIKTYHDEYNYSYSGMLKSLKYAYEIKQNDITKAKGVGIIPFCYQDAYNYFYALWEAKQKNQDKTILLPIDKVITITSPERKIKRREMFSFLDEEIEE